MIAASPRKCRISTTSLRISTVFSPELAGVSHLIRHGIGTSYGRRVRYPHRPDRSGRPGSRRCKPRIVVRMGFTQHLRARGEAGLAALLDARGELAAPPPSSVRALAARAAGRASVERTIAALDALALQCLEAVLALSGTAAHRDGPTGAGAPVGSRPHLDRDVAGGRRRSHAPRTRRGGHPRPVPGRAGADPGHDAAPQDTTGTRTPRGGDRGTGRPHARWCARRPRGSPRSAPRRSGHHRPPAPTGAGGGTAGARRAHLGSTGRAGPPG